MFQSRILKPKLIIYNAACKKYNQTRIEYQRVLKLRQQCPQILSEQTELLIKRIERDLGDSEKQFEQKKYVLEGKLKMTEDKISAQKETLFEYYVSDVLNYYVSVNGLFSSISLSSSSSSSLSSSSSSRSSSSPSLSSSSRSPSSSSLSASASSSGKLLTSDSERS